MKPYEIMLILDSGLDDAVIDATIERSLDIMKNHGATPGRIERWGRRKLAYLINKKPDGYYTLIEATGDPSKMNEIGHQFDLADEIIRHKIISVPTHAAGRSMAAPPNYEDVPAGADKPDRDRGDRGDRDRR